MAQRILRSPNRFSQTGKIDVDVTITLDALVKWAEQVTNVINNLVANTPDDSTASDVAGIVSDFNDLLAVLRGLSTR